MSYQCEIFFKDIPADKVYEFLQNLKTEILKRTDDICKENFLWMPSIRNPHLYKDIPDHIVRSIDGDWVHALLKNRYFYLPKYNLLGIFGLPTALENMFDNVTYFQNGSDRDYDFEDWKGIPLFEMIAHRWKNIFSDADILEIYEKHHKKLKDDELKEFDYEYQRKTLCYDEIWSHFSQFLYDDSICLYISFLGGYELREISNFRGKCKRLYKEWVKENESKAKTLNEAVEKMKNNNKNRTPAE